MRLTVIWGPVLAGLALATQVHAGDPITIDRAHEGGHPSIAADAKGDLHVAYLSYEAGAKVPDIFYTLSPDAGKSWSAGVNVSRTSGISREPTIACGKDGHLVIVWLDTTSGMENPDVYGVYSTDGGKSWSDARDISSTSGKSMDPCVAIAPDGTVHAVWADTTDSTTGPEIWHSFSIDKGATWSKAKNVSHTLGDARCPALACGRENEVFVCWTDKVGDKVNSDIFFASSRDGGKSFSKAANVSNNPGDSSAPSIAVDGSGIYLAWSDSSTRTGQRDIFVMTSRDGGESWEKYIDVAPTPGRSTEPAICAGGGHVAVVWRDTTDHESNPDIWMALSTDHGKSFGAPRDISNTPGVSKHPDAAIVKGRVQVIWQEYERGFNHLKLTSIPLDLH
jgi:hypothetical protein